MDDSLKIYFGSLIVYLEYFLNVLNPLMTFTLLIITILYTYQKYKSEKTKNNK